MNERIKELAEQAWRATSDEVAHLNRIHNRSYSQDEITDIFEIKFAELIVRECARVARATSAPNFHEHLKQQLGHTWDIAAAEAGREIVKHFGVEP